MANKSETQEAIFDPFHYGTELALETTLYPLGFRMKFLTNSFHTFQAVEEGWNGFPQIFSDKSIEVRVVVSDDETDPAATGLIWRAQRHLVTLTSDRKNFAVCDLNEGFASCWLTAATARNHDFFRYYYLDTLIQLLLWQTHLTRVHAGCVARGGRGVLLCGESGAGKSCLSYACARRGWEFITDEASSLVRGSDERLVLGKPRQMHFRETAAAILPELNGRLAAVNATGEISIAVHTADLPYVRTAFQCRAMAVVFLNRQNHGPAQLVPISAEDAFRRLDRDLPLFEEPVREQQRASLRHLVEAGSFELRYLDLDGAVRLIESLVQ